MNILTRIADAFKTKPKKYHRASYTQRHYGQKNQSHLNLLKILGNTLLAIFCIIVLVFSIRGIPGNPTPTDLNRLIWKDNGPLELSPERGRYALMYSLAENKSFTFSPDLARFAAPDVAYTNGKYVSLFAPAVSFVVIPGYLLGKMFGLAQVGSYAVIALFALLNMYLIRAIAIRIGAHPIAATIGGLTFLFASPAFAYAVTLYQHHISTFLILLSTYLLIRYNTLWSLIAIWILCAFSISVDYPNFFMMLPIGVAALGRVFITRKELGHVTLRIPLLRLFSIVFMAIPLAFFLWFNAMSYSNPFQLSGTIERAIEVKEDGTPLLERQKIINELKARGEKIPDVAPEKTTLAFFQSRQLMNGFYTHFISPDRGILMYTPVMLFGIAGLIWAIRKKMDYVALFSAIIGFTIVLYSMWTDPYGGWAFGSRYLIPAYAILAVLIAYLLSKLHRYSLFLLFFFAVFSYSVAVNTLGAITSNRNPPKVEAVALSELTKQEEPYTYMRNVRQLSNNLSKSYVYETYAANTITAWQYYTFLTLFIIIVGAFLITTLRIVAKGNKYEV